MLQPLSAKELDGLKDASRGWESTYEERDMWFDEAQIEGKVPPELNGTFFRNGPGMTNVYGTKLKHPIDGDGLVCALSFMNGKVHFKSKYVQTRTHMEEAEAQSMLYNGAMGSRVPEGVKPRKGFRDPAHTNVFYWGNKLLACHEYALPHTLDPVTLETIGPDPLKGALEKVKALSAHYRYDGVKDVLVVIGFRARVGKRPPLLRVLEYDREWNLVKDATLNVESVNYAHDFLLTPDYYIFHATPFVKTSPELTQLIMQGKTSPGESMKFYPDAPSRMVFIERNPTGERKIIELDTEPCHIYHFCNCKQNDNGTVEFGAVCLPEGFTMEWQREAFLSNNLDAPGVYHDYVADLKNKTLVRICPEKVADRSCEFPTVHPYRHIPLAGACKYVYLMAGQPGKALPFTDIVKYDTEAKTTNVWHSDGVIGEPVFVPRLGFASSEFGDEDDGWVVTQLYHPGIHRTEYVILDAKAIEAGPVCRLKLDFHIPYSFHGTFCPYTFQHPKPRI